MAADTWLRWVKLLVAIQAKPGIKIPELSEKSEMSSRTIYRDLEKLMTQFPITCDGHGLGYRFMGKFRIYPPDLTEEEIMALSIIPSLLDQNKLPDGFIPALDKILASHNGGESTGTGAIERITQLIQTGKPASQQEIPNYLSTVMQAMVESKTIDTVYHTQSRNVTTYRQIDPYYLVPREQRFYLIGYCHKESKVQTFRLSRFRQMDILEDSFEIGKFSIEKYLKNTWSIHRGSQNVTFQIKFSPKVARYVREEELFVRPVMKDTSDGGMMMRVTVNNSDEFIRWLMQYGEEAIIMSPISAREEMRGRLSAWLEEYK